MNKKLKILIVVLLVIAIISVVIGIFVSKNITSDGELKAKESVYNIPYARIIDKEISYDELYKTYVIFESINNLQYIEVNLEDEKENDNNNVKYPDYSTEDLGYIGKKFGLTVTEIEKMDKTIWNIKLLDGYSQRVIYKGKEVKNKATELFGNLDIFNNSFIVNFSNLGLYKNATYSYGYIFDKNLDILVSTGSGSTGGLIWNKIYITDEVKNKDIYKVKFVEAYFRENILMDSYSNPVVNIEMPFANPWQNGQFVSYPTEKEVNEAIEKYQNKLNKYEITFKIDNETYKFEEIKKI